MADEPIRKEGPRILVDVVVCDLGDDKWEGFPPRLKHPCQLACQYREGEHPVLDAVSHLIGGPNTLDDKQALLKAWYRSAIESLPFGEYRDVTLYVCAKHYPEVLRFADWLAEQEPMKITVPRDGEQTK